MAFLVPPLLQSPRLLLRVVEEADLGALLPINGDDAVTRFLPYPTWHTPADAQLWWDRISPGIATGVALQFAVIDKASGELIGTCLLFNHEVGSARADLGYVTGRAHWNRGLTREAAETLIDYAFGACGLRRLEAQAHVDNLASHNLLLKLGFTCEGLLRERWVHKGHAYDTKIYGLLKSERSARTLDGLKQPD